MALNFHLRVSGDETELEDRGWSELEETRQAAVTLLG